MSNQGNPLHVCLAALGVAALLPTIAGAQSASASDEPLEEVVVTGFRGSLEKSLENKRTATNFVDSISAEDVGKLPDNNLAEAIARIPGVQISRTNGEGQQINLRGLSPSFARVTLDGMPISVASEGSVDQQSRNREFDFDLLPSDLFSSLEVIKSPQASIVEGGLSGTVNLRPAHPFDYDGLAVTYKIEGAWQSSSEELDPRASLLVSKNWDDRFGLLLNVAASQRSYRTDGWSSQGWTSGRVGPQVVNPNNPMGPTITQVTQTPDAGYSAGFDWNLPSLLPNDTTTRAPGFINESGLTNAALANAQLPRLGRPELQLGDRDRIGASFAMQFAPSEKLSFTFDALWANLDAEFDRYTNNLLVRNTNAGTNNATGFGFITPRNFVLDDNRSVVSGTLENAKFWSENRLFINDVKFQSFTLGGDWQVTDKVKVSAKVNRAESDFDFRMTTYLLLSDPSTVSLEVNGNGIPTINSNIDIANPVNWQFDTVRVQPRSREEENETAKFDVMFGDDETNIKVGAVHNKFYRLRHTYSTSVGVTQGASMTQFGYTGPANLSQFDITNFSTVVPVNFGEYFDSDPGYRRWAVADLGAFNEMMDPAVLDAAANLDYQNSGNFEEENLAYYGEFNKTSDVFGRTFRFNAGLRYVKTVQDLTGFVQTATTPMAPTTPAIDLLWNIREDDYAHNSVGSEYSEMLPSFNMAYNFTENLIGRFGAARTMTRPSPQDTMPFVSLATTGVVSAGNPDLAPYFSDQYDLSLEWYFSEGAVFATNYFQKNISGFVERRNTPRPFSDSGIPLESITDPTLQALLPQGNNTILLFNQAQNIDGLTKIQGVELFYQQRLDFLLNGLGANVNYTRLDSNGRVVTGLAKHNYNAIVYYETQRFGTRLSYNYRGDYIECPINCGSTSPEAQSRAEAGYLDFNSSMSFEALGQKFTVSLEVLNLLDEEEYSFLGYESRANILNAPGRTVLLGIRGQF